MDQNINYAQPFVAGMISNPLFSNFGESYFNVNIINGEREYSVNNFNSTFFSTFSANTIGNKFGTKVNSFTSGFNSKAGETMVNFYSEIGINIFTSTLAREVNPTQSESNNTEKKKK
ncbi:hypothetical protein OA93_15505 [Flavobacterium sp. KMS]|uniref:hypothetical protein n=1 Tax=Flavobacterium sp. KMS TaxID=1566023 RepID=UPI00057F91B1|nr:hypothetical protein [Flavobacterium sp. KMS]KIA97328.1 hypothetical protein OA93_15505 [Flavobacterium sp. KMS]